MNNILKYSEAKAKHLLYGLALFRFHIGHKKENK